MSQSRLSLALAAPEALPVEGRIALFAPPGDLDLSALPVARLHAIQPFKPDHDRLAARGVAVAPQAEGEYAAAIVFAPRAKLLAKALIAEADARVAPGGPVWIDGAKAEGIDSLLKEVRGKVDLSAPIAKAHGKIALFAASGGLADWAARDLTPAPGFITRPGVFSADGVDEGSALLAACLPETLPARIADLGAGWGWLSVQILSHAGVTSLALFEADRSALDCAVRNVSDPRASFHWDDVTRLPAEARFDAVVMNPPFHQSRSAEPGLGEQFIAAAHRLLSAHGTLWMVANRHLPYADALSAHFREIEELTPPDGASTRFRVTRAHGPVSRVAPQAPVAAARRLAPRKRR